MLGCPASRTARQNGAVKSRTAIPSIVAHAPAFVPDAIARASHGSPRSSQRGFTLIEVMVALIVLVLGVLGAAAMTLTAIRDTKQSGLRSTASALAYELSDLMRANPTIREPVTPFTMVFDSETFFRGAQPASAVTSCWATGCLPADNAKNDFYEWLTKLRGPSGLPNGEAVICRDATKLADAFYPACDNAATSPLVVKLKWDEKNNNARDAASAVAVTTRYMVVTIQPYGLQ